MSRARIPRLIAGVTVLVVAFGLALLSPSAANASVTASLHNQRNGLCLDADNSTGNHDGVKVQLWGCTGASNQRWIINNSIVDGNAHIVNVWSGRCLDMDSSGGIRDGAKVQLWSCGSGSNQNWANNGSPGAYVNFWAHKCLDANINGPNVDRNGMLIQVWGCGGSGASNQQWTVVA
jgi:glucosylceramidase